MAEEKDLIPESASVVAVPSKLVLMPDERLLENHLDFYVSNKRIIQHRQKLIGSTTIDQAFHHIKGLKEDTQKPFLGLGLVLGIISLFIGFAIPFLFVIGAVLIILAFWYKKYNLVIYHIDGSDITIPQIRTETGLRIAKVIRTRVYG